MNGETLQRLLTYALFVMVALVFIVAVLVGVLFARYCLSSPDTNAVCQQMTYTSLRP